MKIFLAVVALLVIAVTPLNIQAAGNGTSDLAGNWKACLTKESIVRKTIQGCDVSFSLRIEGQGIKGGVLMGSYPGYAVVTEGRIEGDRVFLSATAGNQGKGIRIQFTGTLRDGVLDLVVFETDPRDKEGVFKDTGIRLRGKKVG